MAVDDDIVAGLDVVPEGELDVLERFEVRADAFEDVWREESPEFDAKINVLAARAMVVMGPTLWATLVLLWAFTEFSSY